MTADLFKIVFVCTGNRFRSPLAEAFFRQAASGIPVWTKSLGTLELSNKGALPEALAEARKHGLDLTDHRAQSLTDEDLSSVDLVLGFERTHVVKAVVDAHAPRERSFTLPELVGLLEAGSRPAAEAPLERAREAIRGAGTRRDPDLSSVAEVGDPLGGSGQVFRDTAAEVEGLVRRLASALFGPRRAP